MGIIGDFGAVVIGLVLLFAGRRFFWLAAGLIGFLFGYNLVYHFIDIPWLNLLVGVSLGLVLGWLAVKFIRIMSFIVGFLAGAVATPLILGFFNPDLNWLIVSFIGGILGLLLIGFAFKWGLILITSLIGASMIAHNTQDILLHNDWIRGVLGLVLLIIGVFVQAKQKGK